MKIALAKFAPEPYPLAHNGQRGCKRDKEGVKHVVFDQFRRSQYGGVPFDNVVARPLAVHYAMHQWT